MLKRDLKAALAALGIVGIPLCVQADQSTDSPQEMQESTYKPGEVVNPGQLPGAYNQSASYICDDGWDVYVTGDYIYWDWVQDEGMSVGFNGLTGFTSLNLNLTPAVITPGYASGFQVGLGLSMKGMDDWNFYGEYTWYKNNASDSFDVFGNTTTPAVTANFSGTTDISLAYNNADFLLQRRFYFGRRLTGNFYTGLRALWINSDEDTTMSGSASIIGARIIAASGTMSTHRGVSSWALGPKFGFDSNWLLGYGLKFLSNLSASVLYTRYSGGYDYNSKGTGTLVGSSFSLASDVNVQESNYATLRPVLETYLGLGWGSYFYDDAFHADFSVGYDFNVHWNYVTSIELAGSKNSSNLYLHGLNVQARFDF